MNKPSPSPMPLKNCPFCGGKPVKARKKLGECVFCDNCGACPIGNPDTPESNLNAWQTRTPGSDGVGDDLENIIDHLTELSGKDREWVGSFVEEVIRLLPARKAPTPEPVGEYKALISYESFDERSAIIIRGDHDLHQAVIDMVYGGDLFKSNEDEHKEIVRHLIEYGLYEFEAGRIFTVPILKQAALSQTKKE